MNREFNASSKQARSILVVVAILTTALVMASIEGLSQHYSAEMQLASAGLAVVAQL